MLRSSGSSSANATPAVYRGSRAIPQIGHEPGRSATTSGCMGQKYSTVGTPTAGSSAMPHFGQVPGVSEPTSGSMGQMYCAGLRFGADDEDGAGAFTAGVMEPS